MRSALPYLEACASRFPDGASRPFYKGLTLVHFCAQRKHLQREKRYIEGLCNECLGVVQGVCEGCFRGVRGCLGWILRRNQLMFNFEG